MDINKNFGNIKSLFLQYSSKDIAYFLFIHSLWLPNNSSQIKVIFFNFIFLSIKEEEFKGDVQIDDYLKFKQLSEKVIDQLPSFPMLEDYIPELDWGDVKYHFEGQDYKIFYGVELENIYDRMSEFELISELFQKECSNLSDRAPLDEFKSVLKIQDLIIAQISQKAHTDIELGNFETPEEQFWISCIGFLESLALESIISEEILEIYSCSSGIFDHEVLDQNFIQRNFIEKNICPFLFFKTGTNKFIPLWPRRHSSILIMEWEIIRNSGIKDLQDDIKQRLFLSTSMLLTRHAKSRCHYDLVKGVISAAQNDIQKVQGHLLSTAIHSGSSLVLIVILKFPTDKDSLNSLIEFELRKLVEIKTLLSENLPALFLHLENQFVVFQESKLKIRFILSTPNFQTSSGHVFEVPNDKKTKEILEITEFIQLDQLLGILDSFENPSELEKYLEFLNENKGHTSLMSSHLDFLGAFKDSSAVMIDGAISPNLLMLDPHWGSSYRFNTLKNFWESFKSAYFDHPRTWKIQDEGYGITRYVSRGFFGSSLFTQIENSKIFITSPFELCRFEEAKITSFLMDCLAMQLNIHKAEIIKYGFDLHNQELNILFFCDSTVEKQEGLKHVRHLINSSQILNMDIGNIKENTIGIRSVFNSKIVLEWFENPKDCSREIELLELFLSKINEFSSFDIAGLFSELSKKKNNRSTCALMAKRKVADFPEVANPHKPSAHAQKLARKRIAEIAKESNISEGSYKTEPAKVILNTLKGRVVDEFDTLISTFSFNESIGFLISSLDALHMEFFRESNVFELSKEQDSQYVQSKEFHETHTSYMLAYKSYRYLIEKFVQNQPDGEKMMSSDQFEYIVSISDWLMSLYAASDAIHYDFDPAFLQIDSEFRVTISYSDEINIRQQNFSKISYEERQLADPENKSDQGIEKQLIESINAAFKKDLDVELLDIIDALELLSHWPSYTQGEEKSFYTATKAMVLDVFQREIGKDRKINASRILDFIVLDPNDVISLLDDRLNKIKQDDVPVWEHTKRFARYNNRPIIKYGDEFFIWGAYSAYKAQMIWKNIINSPKLNLEFKSSEIDTALSNKKVWHEKNIVYATSAISKQYLDYIEKDCDLHKKNKSIPDIGDFDVIGYSKRHNIIVNIECKHFLPAYSFKDQKKIRDYVFIDRTKKKSHVSKILTRQKYLEENYQSVFDLLGWDISIETPPKVLSFHISNGYFYWSMYPPIEAGIIFESLSRFEKTLCNALSR